MTQLGITHAAIAKCYHICSKSPIPHILTPCVEQASRLFHSGSRRYFERPHRSPANQQSCVAGDFSTPPFSHFQKRRRHRVGAAAATRPDVASTCGSKRNHRRKQGPSPRMRSDHHSHLARSPKRQKENAHKGSEHGSETM